MLEVRSWRLAVGLVLLLLAGCVRLPELPETAFVSPVARPGGRVYVPLVLRPATAQDAGLYANPKRGLGLTYGQCADVTASGAAWYYTWSPTPPSCPGAEAVPMIWGAALPERLGGNSRYLLGPNEPDHPGQANLLPCAGALQWREIEARWPDKLLISPAPSNSPAWLANMRACYVQMFEEPPRFDGLSAHCYRQTAAQCIEQIESFIWHANAWGVREIWVTEYAFLPCLPGTGWAAGDLASALREAEAFTVWMDGQPMITRYAWFAARIKETEGWAFPVRCSTALFDATGQPTVFGQWYGGR